MNLPPLPLIDGVLLLDHSGFFEHAQFCGESLKNSFLLKRIKAGANIATTFGSAIHAGLEIRYRDHGAGEFHSPGNPTSYAPINEAMAKVLSEVPAEAQDHRNIALAQDLFGHYIRKYPREDFSLLVYETEKPQRMVELPFTCHLMDWTGKLDCDPDFRTIPIYLTGKIDLPILKDGKLWIMDHKTAGRLDKAWWIEKRRSSQLRGYCWAASQLLGQPVHGYCVNAIWTREVPATGKPKKLGRVITMDEWWDDNFQREWYHLYPGELDEWHQNMKAMVEDFFAQYNRGYFRMNSTSCSRFGECQYLDCCNANPEDRKFLLASGNFTDNVWSPLNKP